MGSTGSSYVYSLEIESYRLGLTGITGNTGATGSIGATGNSIIGPTGNTGANLVNITIAEDKTFVFHYSDGKTISSIEPIIGAYGYSKIKLLGVSLFNFSPLSNSLTNQTYDSQFPVDILTFKGISSASSPYVRVNYINNNTIRVDFDAINIGFIGISGGTLGNILQNLPGQKQAGITSTKYNEDEASILIQHKNIHESLVICKPNVVSSSLVYWKIDPSQGSIFHINPYTNTLNTNNEINGYVFFIKEPQYGTLSKGITIQFPNTFTLNSNKIYYVIYDNDADIDSGITLGDNFYNRFDVAGIEWQNNSYFCPDSSFNALNLISIGGRYLAYPVQYQQNSASSNTSIDSESLSVTCYPYSERLPSQEFFTGGLCCPGNCTSSAYESISGGCTGYFIPTKRISNSSLCTRKGSCCIKTAENTFTPSELTYCQCATSAGENEFIFHPFEGLKSTLEWFLCDDTCFGNVPSGSCCDGLGNCLDSSIITCNSQGHFFQGIGVKCKPNDASQLNICSGGSGGCCDSGITCVNGYTGSQCISESKSYLGDQKYCQSFNCSPDSIACSQTIPGISELKQGDEYAGGIVVGIFDLDTSKIFGNSIFNNVGLVQNFNDIDTINSDTSSLPFTIRYDYNGYGFDKPFVNRTFKDDKFILIISKEDLEYQNTSDFIWSKNQIAWGYIYNPITNNIEEFTSPSVFNLGEGVVSLTSLPFNTFALQNIRTSGSSIQWLFSQSSSGYTGKWRRNYGLYNTHRLLTSKLLYSEDETLTTPTIYEAIKQYNIDNPPTSERESSWFIPSHDELGFISYLTQQTTDFNINVSLLLSGYNQLDGIYWTSTGAHTTADAQASSTKGSNAWIHNINAAIPENNYSITANRTENTYKVRPIKLIRCDGSYPSVSDETYKLWRLPLI